MQSSLNDRSCVKRVDCKQLRDVGVVYRRKISFAVDRHRANMIFIAFKFSASTRSRKGKRFLVIIYFPHFRCVCACIGPHIVVMIFVTNASN